MRPLEILLLLTLLGGVVAGAVPGFRATWPARRVPLAVALAAAAQVLIEGARWQMAPAYALALAMVLVSRRGSPNGGWRRFLGEAVVTGPAALVLALAAALPFAIPVPRLSAPDGPYGVGTATYHWTDAARPEIFTAAPDDRRELMVQVWYPTRSGQAGRRAPYVEDGAVLTPLARLLRLPGFALSHLPLIRTSAVIGAPAAQGPAFPVLLFSHGRAGFRQHNTFQVEHLVSHGYVVAAIDHPYAASGVRFPDGRTASFDRRFMDRRFFDRVMPYLAQDASFSLDRLAEVNRRDPKRVLTGRLDLAQAGMFGLSMGGVVTAEACLRDARLKACLPMDVHMPADVVRAGLAQPTMWISRDAATMRREGWAEADVVETQTTMRSAFARQRAPGYLVLVPGMYHQDLSDFTALVWPPLGRALGLYGSLDGARSHALIDAYSLAFFDRHLKGAPAPLLDGPSAAYPEVVFARR
ncbi:MAG: carboxylic ester hydrolase [Pseudomonadota bacterium]